MNLDDLLSCNINAPGVRRLRRLRERSVTPWVGSGLSNPMGLPTWSQWVREFAGETFPAETLVRNGFESRLAGGRYGELLQQIARQLKKQEFPQRVKERFGLSGGTPIRGPAVALTLLHPKMLVTTNIDKVIEAVMPSAVVRTQKDWTAIRDDLGVADASKPLVVKLHGCLDREDTWVLTASQYQENYARSAELPSLIEYIAAQAPFLFLGTSFVGDRPAAVLLSALRNNKLLHHSVAILSHHGDKALAFKRMHALAGYNIAPIFYFTDEGWSHNTVEAILRSVWQVSDPPAAMEPTARRAAAPSRFSPYWPPRALLDGKRVLLDDPTLVGIAKSSGAVFVLGRSGDGKSAVMKRIKALVGDEAATQVTDLRNSEVAEAAESIHRFTQSPASSAILLVDSLDELKTSVHGSAAVSEVFRALVAAVDLGAKVIAACRTGTDVSDQVMDYVNDQRREGLKINVVEIERISDRKEAESVLSAHGVLNLAASQALWTDDAVSGVAWPSRLDLLLHADINKDAPSADPVKSAPPNEAALAIEFLRVKLRRAMAAARNEGAEWQRLLELARCLAERDIFVRGRAVLDPEWRGHQEWINRLVVEGVLVADGSLRFGHLKLGDALAAENFLDTIILRDFSLLPARRSYYSEDFYRFVPQLCVSRKHDGAVIDFITEAPAEWQFQLATAFTYHDVLPIERVRSWWEATSLNRIKQKLSEVLFHAGDVTGLLDYLAMARTKPPHWETEAETKHMDFPLVIHRGRRLTFADAIRDEIIATFRQAPACRKYLASMLARARDPAGSPVLQEAIAWTDLTGRHRRYVIAALGYIGDASAYKCLKDWSGQLSNIPSDQVLRRDAMAAMAAMASRLGNIIGGTNDQRKPTDP